MKGYGWEKPLGGQNPGLTAWGSHGTVHMGWLSSSRASVLPRAAQHSFSSLQRQPRAGRSEEVLGSMGKTQCHPVQWGRNYIHPHCDFPVPPPPIHHCQGLRVPRQDLSGFVHECRPGRGRTSLAHPSQHGRVCAPQG